ncbi:helix-turn-helix transcriptional regulator [Sodalis sp. dw_96]|uniref:helix-turn-helix domain-containing protein n=1 Tax=Sodalis sp. dw_96 TaxID=2719794 RepID=UPI001BD6D9F3|nr:helix-turn-helix transcriptional regulator [Sodalis sp. dw_96]
MIPKRLMSARLRANLTQKKLGILAGLDEATAYSRMSHYENGTHCPSFEIVCAIAQILNVPEAYFYTVDDDLAVAVLELHQQFEASKAQGLKPK